MLPALRFAGAGAVLPHLSPQQWEVVVAALQAFAAVAALVLSFYAIRRSVGREEEEAARRRREAAARERATDQQVGAIAYALKNVLSAWSSVLGIVKGKGPGPRAVTFRDVFKDMDSVDRSFSDLMAASIGGASPSVREAVGEAVVMYQEAAGDIRRAARDPTIDDCVGKGNPPPGMSGADIESICNFLRLSRLALSRITPEDIDHARELYWPTK